MQIKTQMNSSTSERQFFINKKLGESETYSDIGSIKSKINMKENNIQRSISH